MNIITQYKMKRMSKARFRHQIILWLIILVVLVGSFPVYNYLSNTQLFDSSELSLFDIAQSTAIVYMVYSINDHRRKIEQNERILRELHQELSIKLAEKDG